MEANAKKEKEAGAAYLVKAAAEKGAIKPPRAWCTARPKAGTGAAPKPEDVVKVHYDRQVPVRQGLRQFGRTQGAGQLPAQWRDSLLDRRRAA